MIMERQWFSARSLVLLLLLLGFVAMVSGAASGELPLLPPVDAAQSGRVRNWETASAPTQVELLMIRLIRTFFGDQVKWSPFSSRSDHLLHTHHHRIVREHRPRHPNLHDELAKRRFRLRGKPVSSTPTSQASKSSQQ